MHDTASVIMRLDIEAVMTRLEGAAYLYLMSVQSERSPSFKQDKKKTVHKSQIAVVVGKSSWSSLLGCRLKRVIALELYRVVVR
jgi:hypothetical protein